MRLIVPSNLLKMVGESRHPCRTPTPQNCMSNLVEGLLEAYEDMVEILLVLEIFLTEDS